ncbi:MAG: transglycosylase SLT domain-containing protein [Spirochaetales bacterium]|nr:transglycosylase SLT domain-containing protein [Spirochaetales bacterium]
MQRIYARFLLILTALLFLSGAAPVADRALVQRVEGLIATRNPELKDPERRDLLKALHRESKRLVLPGIEPQDRLLLLAGFVDTESRFHRYAVSRADARGYMQVKPDTANWMNDTGQSQERGHSLFLTENNVRAGVDYLNYLAGQFLTAREVALAYNAGPGAMRNGIFVESYWTRIEDCVQDLKGMDPVLYALNL